MPPGAGSTPSRWPRPCAGAGAEVEVFGCEGEELERLAAAAPERIAVAGGDGTIGPLAALAGRLGVPLGVIATGTANDFARVNDLPDDPLEAARLAASGQALRGLELGRLADGRPFVNVASAGLALGGGAPRARRSSALLGPLAYAVGALQAAATERPLDCTLRVDGAPAFAGGAGRSSSPPRARSAAARRSARPTRPTARSTSPSCPPARGSALARRAWGLRRGTIAEQRDVEHHRGGVVEVDLPPGTELNVDGEIRDGGLERVTVEPRAYALVVPG